MNAKRLAAELGQIDAGQETDRKADQRRDADNLRAADDGVGHAAARLAGRSGSLREEIPDRGTCPPL